MNKRNAIYTLFFCSFLFYGFSVSVNENNDAVEKDYVLNLRWVKGYETEKKENVETGIKWSLSFLGAMLPKGSFAEATQWNDNILFVDFNKLGFSDNALNALHSLIKALKKTGEYKKYNAIDIGRFIMLTLNSSKHYYAITDINKKYAEFRSRFRYGNTRAAIMESCVSSKHRLIDIGQNNEVKNISFIASEGHGRLDSGVFTTEEFEVFDIMPNGQLRFAVYDSKGNLKNAADASISSAGKPAKCLWCHEKNIQPPFFAKTALPGYYTPDSFKTIVLTTIELLEAYRSTLNGEIDYRRLQEHTQAELLYINFMEPSAERLSREWNMPLGMVTQKLAGLPMHTHPEFPYLGILYNRMDVDRFAPYSMMRVPQSARELSGYEPNVIK